MSDGKTVRNCYEYDAAGNMVKGQNFTEENGTVTNSNIVYLYNSRNQLCSVTLNSGEGFEYTYNAKGLRASKMLYNKNGRKRCASFTKGLLPE